MCLDMLIHSEHLARSTAFSCDNQCTNNGRYCNVDPEDDLDKGASGADVVQENLRQLCFWREMNATGDISPYWNYISKFDTDCSILHTWESCSWDTMEAFSEGSKVCVCALLKVFHNTGSCNVVM